MPYQKVPEFPSNMPPVRKKKQNKHESAKTNKHKHKHRFGIFILDIC